MANVTKINVEERDYTISTVASLVSYDSSTSGLSSTTVQSAIEEVNEEVNKVNIKIEGGLLEVIKIEMEPYAIGSVLTGGYDGGTPEVGEVYRKTTASTYETGTCWKIAVQAGETYKVIAHGLSGTIPLYILTGEDSLILEKITTSNTKPDGVDVEITEDGYLYVNDGKYGVNDEIQGKVIKLQEIVEVGLRNEVENLEDRVTDIEGSTISVVDNLDSSSAIDALSAKQGKNLNEKIEGTIVEVEELLTPKVNSYYKGRLDGVEVQVGDTYNSDPSGTANSIACWKTEVRAGETYRICVHSTAFTTPYYIITNTGHIVTAIIGPKNTKPNGEDVEITEDGYLYVNDSKYGIDDEIQGWVKRLSNVNAGGLRNEVENLEYRVTDLESSTQTYVSPLKGKKIAFFGDSIITVASSDESKDVTQYIAEKTGANVLNFAIGGSHLEQRGITLTPANSTEGAKNLDIINMIDAICNNDYRYVEAGALASNNDDVGSPTYQKILNMEDVDWSTVDIIAIQGGTNDYQSGKNLGTDDSTTVSTTLGAVNHIIQQVCSTFKHIKVIGVSTVPIYWGSIPTFDTETSYAIGDVVLRNRVVYVFIDEHAAGAWNSNEVVESTADAAWRTEDKFSDFHKNTYLDLTLRELTALIEDRYNFYHLTYANVYETLGWNMFNFSEFYEDRDSHHPRKGLPQLAESLIEYLERLVK